MATKKAKTPLQRYLSKKLPPFQRGTGDCVAFVAGWVNDVAGKTVIELKPLTFGDVVRSLRKTPLVRQVAENLESLGWAPCEGECADGDIAVVEHPAATGGKAIGIFADGKVITRFEKADLFVIQEPEIVARWTLK